MAKSPELWAFILANGGLFVVSGLLTALSYLAYRQSGKQRTYMIATVGFGFIVLGGLAAPVFQLTSGIDYALSRKQILVIETVETGSIAFGLGLLFYAITQRKSGSAPSEDGYSSALSAEDIDTLENQQYRN